MLLKLADLGVVLVFLYALWRIFVGPYEGITLRQAKNGRYYWTKYPWRKKLRITKWSPILTHPHPLDAVAWAERYYPNETQYFSL